MGVSGSGAGVLRRLTVFAAIVCLVTGMLVAYGKHCIGRGAKWKGFSIEGGVALVFMCDPDSGIRRAFFYIVPFKKVSLEKIDSGA